MNELFNLKQVEIAGHQIRAVDARELHAFLEVGRVFASWITDRIEQGCFVEGKDYVLTVTKTGVRSNVVQKDYAISVSMAKELSMLERNEQGKLARQYFIECEDQLATIAPEQHQIAVSNWRKARIETRDYQKVMVSALHLSRARQGKDTSANHYTKEANMLYGLLLGTTAKKWLSSKGLTGELRQHLFADQLEHLAYLERTNIALIELDMSYQQRKEKLTELFTRHLLEKTA